MRKYGTLYERLVSNTVLSVADNPSSCWLWTGHLSGGYPRFAARVPGGGRAKSPRGRLAHRAILEEVLDVTFPFDEAGHLCGNPACINPDHLEVQTQAHNLSERRGCADVKGRASWIPVLFPRDID